MLRGSISFISDTFWIFRISYARARAPSYQFFAIFTDPDVIFSDFQIDEMVSECPKIMKISKSSLYTLNGPKVALNPMRTSKKCFAHGLWVFRPFFDSCSGHFDAKNTYFDVFFMFFDDFGRSQLLGSVIRGCRGAQEPKKIKIAKNGLKHPQTIIECHFEVFGVRTIGVGHHMSQFIFTDFWVFWGYFRGKMHYMSMLQRMASISKLGFWQNFGGPRGDPQKKKSAETKKFFLA